jgi:hypothetical protein
MLELKLELPGLDRSIRGLELLTEKNLRFATGRAMNSSAWAARSDLQTTLGKTSGGPIQGGATRWTIGAAYVSKASAQSLAAEVGLRSDTPRAAGRYISVLTKGTRPREKAVDRSAARIAGQGRGVAVIPSRSAGLTDQRGNVSLRSYATIIGKARTGADGYFVAPVRRGSSTMAVFQRKTGFIGRTSTLDSGIRRMFTLDPSPKARGSTYDIKGDLNRSIERVWPGKIRQLLMEELARAGFR